MSKGATASDNVGAGTDPAVARLLPGDPGEWRTAGAVPSLALPSHLGLDGRVSVLASPTGMAVLKRYHPGTAIDPSHAANAYRLAGEEGIAPAFFGVDEDEHVIAMAHPGPAWRMASGLDFDVATRVEQAVALLRRWHVGALLDRPAPVLADLADRAEAVLGERMAMIDGWAGLRSWIEHIDAGLAAIGADRTRCHRELYVSNFLVSDGAMLLVDFDHAADDDPYADLGGLALALCEVDADYPRLIELYAGSARRDLVARTRLHAIREDFRWGTAALLSYGSMPDPVADFLGYGQLRLLRCAGHLASWDVGSLLLEAGR